MRDFSFPQKPRLPALDSIRFFLISYIATGHFVTFGTKNAFVIKLFAQINVVVGAFFVLSGESNGCESRRGELMALSRPFPRYFAGYVAAYTATELGKYEASPRVRPASAYILSRIAGYYPLHLVVTLLFAPMFLFVDLKYNGPIKAAFHGLLSLTLTQVWPWVFDDFPFFLLLLLLLLLLSLSRFHSCFGLGVECSLPRRGFRCPRRSGTRPPGFCRR